MFPSFLPQETQQLTEAMSIALAQIIERQPIASSLAAEVIATTYVHQGQGGPPLLLLHGFDSSVFEFRRLLPLLAQQCETWAVDLLGFGFTERLNSLSFSTAEIATHLYEFWQGHIQQPVVLVGASMGGATALDFTLKYPHVVRSLVLLDSAGLQNPPAIGKFMIPPLDFLATEIFLGNARVRQSISRAAYCDKRLANQDALTCAKLHLHCPRWRQALIAFTKSGGYGSYAAQLGHIRQPTLILWGAQDQILGTDPAQQFVQAIAHSKLVWIEQCGHVPHLEKPQETAHYLLDCLQNLEPPL